MIKNLKKKHDIVEYSVFKNTDVLPGGIHGYTYGMVILLLGYSYCVVRFYIFNQRQSS